MATPRPDDTGFVVVPRRPGERAWRVVAWLGWPACAVLVGLWAFGGAPRGADPATAAVGGDGASLEAARQEIVTLRRSDQISRAANTDLQQTLAERDEEIAALRADVQFYERLVGATGQRRGLSVHAVRFEPEAGGSWRYAITLTQNLNRGAISAGRMRFSVEGVAAGKLETLDWTRLRPAGDAGQAYSFRYFQELEGSIVLPAGFVPQRVRVRLDGGGAPLESTLPWAAPGASPEAAPTPPAARP